MFKKSKELKRISLILGVSMSGDNYLQGLAKKGLETMIQEEESAQRDLFALIETDPLFSRLRKDYQLNYDRFHDVYLLLVQHGACVWISGHYVVASSLVFAPTMEYILRNQDASDFHEVVSRLCRYFDNNETKDITDQHQKKQASHKQQDKDDDNQNKTLTDVAPPIDEKMDSEYWYDPQIMTNTNSFKLFTVRGSLIDQAAGFFSMPLLAGLTRSPLTYEEIYLEKIRSLLTLEYTNHEDDHEARLKHYLEDVGIYNFSSSFSKDDINDDYTYNNLQLVTEFVISHMDTELSLLIQYINDYFQQKPGALETLQKINQRLSRAGNSLPAQAIARDIWARHCNLDDLIWLLKTDFSENGKTGLALAPPMKGIKLVGVQPPPGEHIRTLAEDLFELAHEFVAIREKSNHQAGGFLSLFKKIDFEKLHQSAEFIRLRIDKKAREIDAIKTTIIKSKDPQVLKLFHLLHEYKEALLLASNIYAQKMELAFLRAQGKTKVAMSLIIEISREEISTLDECQRTGDELTEYYHEIYSD